MALIFFTSILITILHKTAGDIPPPYSDYNDMYREDVAQCLYQGKQVAEDLYRREDSISSHITCQRGTPEYAHHANHRPRLDTLADSQHTYSLLMATKLLQHQLAEKYGMTPNTFSEFLNAHGFPIYDIPQEFCHPSQQYNCLEDYKYRTLDGSCNNLYIPSWGKANTALERLLPGHYSDGVYAPPTSVTGKVLPNARILSRVMFTDQPLIDPEWTQAFVQFGQLMGHDFAAIVTTQTYAGGIQCCTEDGTNALPQELRHHACFPIYIPEDDPFYSYFNQHCMNFVRSMTIPREECKLGVAEQINSVSSYLDASVVYGSDKITSDSLRSFYYGQLRVENKYGRSYLPRAPNATSCDLREPAEPCYVAGDNRANQDPTLTIFHTVFVREHNRISLQLAGLNPHWDEERLFQEARIIVIAIFQKISYYDWLPILINVKYLVDHRVLNEKPDYSYDYSPHVNGGTLNEFTTAAYRYLHTMVHGFPSVLAPDRNEYDYIRLRDHFNRPNVLEQGEYFDGLLRGMTTKLMLAADEHYTTELTQWLFAGTKPFGIDLESFDIQRGRDHGLESYVQYRVLCGFPQVYSFEDLKGHISDNLIYVLQQIYADVRDIDFFVGAALEIRVEGSLIGPTLQCVIGEQFYRWRVGDRFFFESHSNPNRLTPYQLEQVRKVTMARVFCDNGDYIKYMQPDVFRKIDEKNPLIPCESIPSLDLTVWQEHY